MIISGLEESVAQRHLFNALHIRIIDEVRINIEEDRHIDSLSSVQSLLFEAETLNLGKIRRDLTRSDTVRSNPNDIIVRLIRSSVESERGFSRKDSDFALLGNEFPRKDIRNGPVEGNADALGRSNGSNTLRRIAVGAAVGSRFDRLASPADGLADLFCQNGIEDSRIEDHTIL